LKEFIKMPTRESERIQTTSRKKEDLMVTTLRNGDQREKTTGKERPE